MKTVYGETELQKLEKRSDSKHIIYLLDNSA